MNNDPKRDLLCHMVKTVAFRGRIATNGAPPDFADFSAGGETRTPADILAHIGDLLNGSLLLLKGEFVELVSQPLAWNDELSRFFSAAKELGAFLAGDEPLAMPVETFVQGPIGDALTHIGQIVMLRRLAGCPIEPVPYFAVDLSSELI